MAKDVKRTVRLHLMLTPDEAASLDDYRYSNRISSLSEAVRRLIRIGWEVETRRLIRRSMAPSRLDQEHLTERSRAMMTKNEFLRRANVLFGGNLSSMTEDQLFDVVVLSQYCIRITLGELKTRGLLEIGRDGLPPVMGDLPDGVEWPPDPLEGL